MTNSLTNHNASTKDSSTDRNAHLANINQRLMLLISEACQHTPGSRERQEKLNKIISEIQCSGKIWRDTNICYEDYEDALQKAWIIFCRNICKYKPEKGKVIDWFNGILRNQLKDAYQSVKKEQNRRVNNDEELDLIDNLPAPKPVQPILEDTLKWIETEGEKLRSLHIRNCQEINCQVLLSRRLPPENITWEQLEKEFSVSRGTLSTFYQRKCYPCLLAFAREQGYIDT